MQFARARFFPAVVLVLSGIAGAQSVLAEPKASPQVVGNVGGQAVVHMGGGSPPVPIPSTRAQAAPAAGTVEDVAAEIEREKAAQTAAWAGLNNLNPFNPDAGKNPAVAGQPGPFEQLNRLLSQPAVQGYLKLFSNPTFARGVDQIIQSPRRMTLLYVQLGFIVFMMFFRAWRFSKTTSWIKKLWTQFWTFVMFWAGAVVVIPWVVLGDPYFQTMAGLLDVLLTSMRR
jgi:hypothetical protein